MGIEADAGISLGEASLNAMVALELGLGAHGRILTKLLEMERRYQEDGPVFHRVQNVGASDSSSDAFPIGLGGPAVGRRWEVRNLVVGGLQWSSTVAGNALVILSAVNPSVPAVVSTSDVRDYAATLPSKAFYSSGQIVVRHPNHLRVVIVSPTASTSYVAAGLVIDSPDLPLRSRYTE